MKPSKTYLRFILDNCLFFNACRAITKKNLECFASMLNLFLRFFTKIEPILVCQSYEIATPVQVLSDEFYHRQNIASKILKYFQLVKEFPLDYALSLLEMFRMALFRAGMGGGGAKKPHFL